MRPGCSPSWSSKRQWIQHQHPSEPPGDSGRRSCFLPLAACDKRSQRMVRAAVGMQEGEVCVIPSAWESHKQTTRLLFEPRGVHASPQARPGLDRAHVVPRSVPGAKMVSPVARHSGGGGWGPRRRRQRRRPRTNGLLVPLMLEAAAGQTGQGSTEPPPCSGPEPRAVTLGKLQRVQGTRPGGRCVQ